MPGSFTYDPSLVVEEVDDGYAIPYIALGGPGRESKIVTFSIPGTGLLAVDGFDDGGAPPDCVILFGARRFPNDLKEAASWHFGVATDPSEQWGMGLEMADNTVTIVRNGSWRDDRVITGVGCEAALNSLDAGGNFTLDVISGSIPSTLVVVALVLRGGGSYKAGTAPSGTAAGTTSVSGLGFAPDCVLLGTMGKTANGQSANVRCGLGAFDAVRQAQSWAGSDTASTRTRQYHLATKCLAVLRQVGLGGPTILLEGERDSLDADGFTIDWTTVDGTAYRYGYLAFEDAATDRFIHDGVVPATGPQVVSTPIAPLALLGFHGWAKPAEDGFGLAGASLGVSACDENLDHFSASWHDHDNPPANAQQSDSYLSTLMFGTQPRITGGGVGEVGSHATQHDCLIQAFASDRRRPQIYRRTHFPG